MNFRKKDTLSLIEMKIVRRKAAKLNRRSIHDKIGYEASMKVSGYIENFLRDYKNLNVIAAYMPINSELDLGPTIIKLRTLGKKICLPTIISKNSPLQFKLWNKGAELVNDKFNVLIPMSGKIVEPDLILCPMLSFDLEGFRLGYGGGFYDRTIDYLSKKKPVFTLGCAYSQQLSLKLLPKGYHDKALDGAITETGITLFNK